MRTSSSMICKGCWSQLRAPVVIRGPLSIPFRLVGLRISRMNPNVCTMCERWFTRIIRFKKWGTKQIGVPATVLFADLRGYTSLSESLDSPQVARILSRFYENCASAIWERDGIVNKLIGDAILALFNWPIKQGDHVQQAVMAGIELQRRCLEIGQIEGVSVGIGVGIQVGDISIGELSEVCKDYTYTAFGPVVNLAARLQGAAQPGEVLVTEEVYRHVEGLFPEAESRVCHLKGIDKPVNAHVLRVKQ